MKAEHGRKLQLTLSTREYLEGLEFRLSRILERHTLPLAADDELAEIADELRRAAWKIRQRHLREIQRGKTK